jgi:hypothetical protein
MNNLKNKEGFLENHKLQLINNLFFLNKELQEQFRLLHLEVHS